MHAPIPPDSLVPSFARPMPHCSRACAERDAAAHAAWSAPGVTQVVNDVVVSA